MRNNVFHSPSSVDHSLLTSLNFHFLSGTIKQILEYVVQGLNDCEHLCFGFHLEEFLTGLSHLAVNDENKELVRACIVVSFSSKC